MKFPASSKFVQRALALSLVAISLSSPAFGQKAPDEALKILQRINEEVNSEITYLSDMENYGVKDLAVTEPEPKKLPGRSFLAKYGDCEDYALTKKARLIKAGVSPKDIQVVGVQVPRRPLHAVLLARVGNCPSPLILDSYDDQIRTQRQREKSGWVFGNLQTRASSRSEKEPVYQEMQELVNQLDRNHDGVLQTKELRNVRLKNSNNSQRN
jgi:predicted transglutaminase-like cysteine proteinase